MKRLFRLKQNEDSWGLLQKISKWDSQSLQKSCARFSSTVYVYTIQWTIGNILCTPSMSRCAMISSSKCSLCRRDGKLMTDLAQAVDSEPSQYDGKDRPARGVQWDGLHQFTCSTLCYFPLLRHLFSHWEHRRKMRTIFKSTSWHVDSEYVTISSNTIQLI